MLEPAPGEAPPPAGDGQSGDPGTRRRRRRRHRGRGGGAVQPAAAPAQRPVAQEPRVFGPKPPRAPRPWVKNRDKVSLEDSSYGAQIGSHEPAAPAKADDAPVDYTPTELWRGLGDK